MSTLNEIAANHARMAKALAMEATEPSEQQPLIVGSFEVVSIETPQHMALHLIAGAQDNHLAQATGYVV